MPRNRPYPPRKQRTREHVLADLSVNYVERVALQCGFAVQEIWHDYGFDLTVFTFNERGLLEGGMLWMQVKATDHLKKTHDRSAVLVRIDRRDLLAWIAELNPVVLVVYDGKLEQAYWLWIQESFREPSAFANAHGQTVTIRIPARQLLTEEVFRELARRKAAIPAAQRKWP